MRQVSRAEVKVVMERSRPFRGGFCTNLTRVTPFLLLLTAFALSCTSVNKLQREYEAGDSSKLDKLIEIAGRGDYPYGTRKNAVVVLGEIGDPLAVPILIQILRQYERRSTLQEAAIVALGKIGDRRAVEAIAHVLDRSVMDPAKADLRLNAWSALGDLGGDEAAGILVNGLAFFDKLMLREEQRSARGVFSGDEQGLQAWRDSLRVPRGIQQSGGGGGGLFPQDNYPSVSMFGTPMDELDRPAQDYTPQERNLAHGSLVQVGEEAISVIIKHVETKETTLTLRAELDSIVEEILRARDSTSPGS